MKKNRHIVEQIMPDSIAEEMEIEPGDEIVAGISGGADSVCMLLNLLELKI